LSGAPGPWWRADIHEDRRGRLLARNRIKRDLRAWFELQGFTEVETASLQVSPGNETHLHAFETTAISEGGRRRPFYLPTSPEFACKKLLAAGETRIFEFAPAFRNRERGALHHPQFTMLEWYRVGATYEALMADCADILRLAAEALDRPKLVFRGREADPLETPERLTVSGAFERYAGIDLPATLDDDGAPDRAALGGQAEAAGIRVAEDDSGLDVFSRVLLEKIEPRLGDGRATILCDYPAAQAALARPKADDPRFAERFELYACGVELANAFGELTDPVVQRSRLDAEMDAKARLYGQRYPLDEDFLAALGSMPSASGAALGFDRLVMLLVGAPRIDDVIWTPVA
jgi:lysyl-tRNA synthetase class 2